MKRVVALLSWCLLTATCGAATNSMPSVATIEFRSAPLEAVVDYLASLTREPVIVRLWLTGAITYKSPGPLSFDQAVEALSAALRSSGVALINVESRYIKLVSVTETNQPVDRPRVEIAIERDALTVDNAPVALDGLVAAVQKRATPESEVWIYDAGNSTNLSSYALLQPLQQAEIRFDRIFSAHLPRSSRRRSARAE